MDFNSRLNKLEKIANKKSIPLRIRNSLLYQIKYLRENVDAQLIDHPIAERKLPRRHAPRYNTKLQVSPNTDLIELDKELPIGKGKPYTGKSIVERGNIIDRAAIKKSKSTKTIRKHAEITQLPPLQLVKDDPLMRTYKANYYHANKISKDYYKVISQLENEVKKVIKEDMDKYKAIKAGLAVEIRFIKKEPADKKDAIEATQVEEAVMKTSSDKVILNTTKIDDVAEGIMKEIITKVDQFTYKASGWIFDTAKGAELHISTYAPYRAGSYIKTPEWAPARCILNVQNNDEECFKWAILAAVFPADEHATRVSKYKPHQDKLNFNGIKFPASIKDIIKFEKQNKSLSICVYYYDDNKKARPLHISDRYNIGEKTYTEVNLLQLREEEKTHYATIKSFETFCQHYNKAHYRKYPCRRCMRVMSSEAVRKVHMELCKGINDGTQCVRMPKEGEVIKFKDYANQIKAPVVIYADFECSNVDKTNTSFDNPCEDPNCKICERHKKRTVKEANQEANSYCYVIVRTDGLHKAPVIYRGENAAKHLLKALDNELEEIYKLFDNPKPLIVTPEILHLKDEASTCWACNKPFTDDDGKVMDHDHITGEFRGIAHNSCNLKMTVSRKTKIPVVFHNLRGYDSHLIISALGTSGYKYLKEPTCIPNNMEKYMSFTVGPLKFIDSFQFLGFSLDNLVKYLQPNQLTLTRKFLDNIYNNTVPPEKADEVFNLVKSKGVYPYSYIDSFIRFEEEELPPIEAFYNDLAREDISDKEYKHALNVWNIFNCKNFGDYHDIYLKTDVLLLADVFENYRTTSIRDYKLDAAHYISIPGLSWAAMLKMTNINLELINDEDLHMKIEKGIRGGISTIGSIRHVKVNNKYCPDYDPTKPSDYLEYIDANSLYSTAMRMRLPYEAPIAVDKIPVLEDVVKEVMNITPDDELCRLYIVDLEYPKELHDKHNDYPLAPENYTPPYEELSDYIKELYNKLEKKYTPQPKLAPNLHNKENYLCHGLLLKLYLEQGLKITKVHEMYTCKQSNWMAEYIDFNIEQRKQASKENRKLDVTVAKLSNNAVYGKTLENLRNRVNVELVNGDNITKIAKKIASPAFESRKTYEGGLVAIKMKKQYITLNRPIYIGFAVLELSKYIMYDFWYNHIKKEFGDRVKLVYTDTDSLVYIVTMENNEGDIYEFMHKHKDLYDFSEYPKTHFCYDPTNEKVTGKFKDEAQGRAISEFVALTSKMYSFKIASLNKENDTKVFKKAKGVTKCVTEKSLSFDNYKKCLHDQQTFANEQTLLRSKNHKIGLYKQLKASLSPIDTKRYVLDNGIDTLAFGHYKIAEIKEATHIAREALATQYLLELSNQTLEESCKAVEIKDIISNTSTTEYLIASPNQSLEEDDTITMDDINALEELLIMVGI